MFNTHIVTNSFTLLLCTNLQKIQHVTVKDIHDVNIFYRGTFNKQLGIPNFDLINCIILK